MLKIICLLRSKIQRGTYIKILYINVYKNAVSYIRKNHVTKKSCDKKIILTESPSSSLYCNRQLVRPKLFIS